MVVQQIRQRCTVRQDLESPLYISDQLRLREQREVISLLPQDTSSAEELRVQGTEGHFPHPVEAQCKFFRKTKPSQANFPYASGFSGKNIDITEKTKIGVFSGTRHRNEILASIGDHLKINVWLGPTKA